MNKREASILLKNGNLLIVLRSLSTLLAFSLIIAAYTLNQRTYIAWGVLLLIPGFFMLFSAVSKALAGRGSSRRISDYNKFQHKLKRLLGKNNHKTRVGLLLIGLIAFDEGKGKWGFYTDDLLLIKIERILAALLYKNKRTFHYSEGKFAVIIRAEEFSQIIAKAEKLRRKLTGFLEQTVEEKCKTHVAVGVSLFPDHAGCWQSLLQTAEDALARAVAIRGGRVQVYHPILVRFSCGMNKKTKRQLEIITKEIWDQDRLIYGHSERVFVYTQLNCRELGLSAGKALPIECAAILHDLGKVTDRENDAAEHPSRGANTLRPLIKTHNMLIPSVLYHHERYDGSGYPSGLKGSEIPLGARIIAVADFFDHVTAESADNGSRVIHEGINMLQRCKGSFFDPLIVDAFVKHVGKYKDLSQIIEWPKDLSKIVPTGYNKPGCFQLGGHYADFYSGEIHFMVKAVVCIAGGLINQEKCLYLTDDKKEKHILRNLYRYINSLTKGDVFHSFGRLEKITFPANIIMMDKKSAKFALEIKKLFKIWLDHAQKDNCDSLRLIIDHSSLNIRGMELDAWEKAISRCAKNLDVIVSCFYDINSMKFPEDTHAIAQLHDSLFPEP